MASAADLRKELDCSICLAVYADPVTLRCGHSFCQACIAPLLDTQDASGRYCCPECRERFPDKPALNKNVALNNIAKAFHAAELDHQDTTIRCTYCIHFPVPAVTSCVLCEASLCQEHLSVHSKSPEHVLCEPSAHQEAITCSFHKKILEYYCKEDTPCICTSCHIPEEHWGLWMNEAFEKNEEFRNVMKDTLNQKQKIENRVQILQEGQSRIPPKSDHRSEKLAPLFRDMKNQLEDLEKRTLSSEQVFLSKLKKGEVSRKTGHSEEMRNTSDSSDHDEEEEEDTDDGEGDLDVTKIVDTLQIIFDIITGVNLCFYRQKKSYLFLDKDTAYNYIKIDDNTAYKSNTNHKYPETPERFEDAPQVLSYDLISSGQHYWDVEVRYPCVEWSIGMCYPSVDRKGKQARTGNNDKSWGLYKLNDQLLVIHDRKAIVLPYVPTCKNVRIYLDYERGQISFYELLDPIRHIYTFNATFTEPLYVVLGILNQSGSLSIPE